MSFLRWIACALTLAYLAANAFLTLPFLTASLFGTREWAEATPYTYVTCGKNHTRQNHYALRARADDGFTLTQDVSRELYSEVSRAAAPQSVVAVPILRTGREAWASFIGTTPYTSGVALGLVTLGFAIALGVVRAKYRTKYAWYDREKLAEHGGKGHWRETRPMAPVDPLRD